MSSFLMGHDCIILYYIVHLEKKQTEVRGCCFFLLDNAFNAATGTERMDFVL